jgi:hypothetical protein
MKKNQTKLNFFELEFVKYQTILVCSLPLLMIIGAAVSDIVVSIVAIGYAIYAVRNNATLNVFIDKNIFKYLLIFYLFIIFSSLFSTHIFLSLKFSLPYIRFILLAFLIAFLIKNNSNQFYKFFFISCIVSLSLLFVGSVYEIFSGKNLLGYENINNQSRITGLFRKAILGSYVLKILPIFLVSFFFMKKEKNYNNGFFFLIFFFSAILIFISGDRAPLLLFSIFSLGCFLFLKNYRKKIITILLSLIFIFLFLIATQKRYYDRYITRTLNEIGIGVDKDYNYNAIIKFSNTEFYNKNFFIFSPVHTNYLTTSINIFKDNIYIGAGPKSYSWLSCAKEYKIDEFSCMTHPHNFYAQLLAETGIFGFGIVSFAFFYFIIYLFKITSSVAKKYEFSKEGLIISSLGLLIHLWPLTPHGSFFTNYNCIFIFLCLGFFLGEKKII